MLNDILKSQAQNDIHQNVFWLTKPKFYSLLFSSLLFFFFKQSSCFQNSFPEKEHGVSEGSVGWKIFY